MHRVTGALGFLFYTIGAIPHPATTGNALGLMFGSLALGYIFGSIADSLSEIGEL